jgi:large subunit ribosomal protein L25
LPKDLPEFIEVDVSGLDIGESLHLSDLALPGSVRLASLSHGESGDLAVVTVVPPKVEPTETPEAG